MDKQTLAKIVQEGGSIVSALMRTYPRQHSQQPAKAPKVQPDVQPQSPEEGEQHLTTEETVRYQRREIGKELLLLEKHLQQGCKIAGKEGQPVACDCCGGKHMITLEALAQETLGMTVDPALNDLIQWVREVEPKTTEEASASGKFDKEYPRLAIKARELRKAVVGTESTSALLSKEVNDAINKESQD